MRVQEVKSAKVSPAFTGDYNKYEKISRKFTEALEEELNQYHQDKLNEVLSKIDDAAKKLKESLTIEDLLNYKKLVKKFLKEATNGMLKYTKREQIDIRGRKKIYSIIEKVNKKLEKLTEEFLNNNIKNLEILKMIDDIRGLLVDIYS